MNTTQDQAKAALEFLYDLTLDTSNLDEEIGDVDGFGWHGFLNFDWATAKQVNEFLGVKGLGRTVYFTTDESPRRLLGTGFYGAVVSVDQQGFKTVEYFEGSAEYESAVEEIASEFDAFMHGYED